ncbi:MAG: methylthioribose-1-phosphate isomerase [Leptospiraceae bacterium]|nr:MAG: methylthioribose-1-phosphate isomerase [Leptospiraceae bacterium]
MIYIQSIKFENDQLQILDQAKLPIEKKYIYINNLEEACEAIINLRIRGAPAIGVMAALSIYIEMKRQFKEKLINNLNDFKINLQSVLDQIGKTRPTAVNLFYAIRKIKEEILNKDFNYIEEALNELKKLALIIFEEDKILCDKIGEHGASLIFDGANILTHCNTGSLATAGKGTALGAIYTAVEMGKKVHVYNTETRPLLQGSRLTSFELNYAKIPNTLITDNMVASLFSNKKIDMVLVGADRITKNGDTANKIGTYSIAILANYFNIPFYVLAPYTTIDTNLDSGDKIIIEERKPDEVKTFQQCISAPYDVNVYNPAFDVTPSRLITAIITEKGIFRFPYHF